MTEPINNGVLEHADPFTLMLEDNVRPDQALTKQFIASIKENGVLVPIVAVRLPDGTLTVRMGARRTMAAREAQLSSVPVYVTEADADTVTRLTQQISENDHRLGLRADDRVRGIQAMLDTGLSATKVAKKLSVSMERVKLSKAVASSQVALDALHDNNATLAEAAALAEFADDQDAVDRLLRCAGGNYFDHELARLRQGREARAAWEDSAARYRTLGFEVLDDRPASFSADHIPLHALRTAAGEEATSADVTEPRYWAVTVEEESVITDKETGDVIDEDQVDWSTEGNPDAVPEEGLRHAESVNETLEYVATEYYCLDPEAAGLTPDERFTRFSGMGTGGDVPTGGDAGATVNDLATQQEKRERRKVLALNKAGDAAQTVRREFVKNMLSRKTPPKGAAVFVARMLAADGYLLSNFKADETIADLLDIGPTVRAGIDELIDNATDGRAQVITLGLVLGALEGRTPKHAWRNDFSHFVGPKDYLRFLADNGYTLSTVEQVIVGDKKADDCYDELTDSA
jgi:ParB family chromosome partitioning protein